jgi:hypothetical protein
LAALFGRPCPGYLHFPVLKSSIKSIAKACPKIGQSFGGGAYSALGYASPQAFFVPLALSFSKTIFQTLQHSFGRLQVVIHHCGHD